MIGAVGLLEEIHANLVNRLAEAKEQGWLGEVAAIETTIAAAAQKLEAMRTPAAQQQSTLECSTSAHQVGRSSLDAASSARKQQSSVLSQQDCDVEGVAEGSVPTAGHRCWR